jgi:hypothetical protein
VAHITFVPFWSSIVRPSVFRVGLTLLIAAPPGGLGAQSNIRDENTGFTDRWMNER